jgi:hypothetical protein
LFGDGLRYSYQGNHCYAPGVYHLRITLFSLGLFFFDRNLPSADHTRSRRVAVNIGLSIM